MEFRVLKYFVTIVQEGNISNAANVLHISQSTLSRQIKDLEEELETTLFDRGNRYISLTEDGNYLYSRALEIIQIAHNAEATIKSSEMVTGDLHVGVGENYMADLVAKVFQEILDQYPDVRVHLHNVAGDLIPNEIDRGILDFGFATSQRNLDDYYQLPFDHQDLWGILMPKDCSLTKLAEIKPKDLNREKIIIGRQNGLIKNWQKWLGRYAAQVKEVGTYDMAESMYILVKSGVGLAVTFDKRQYHKAENQLIFRPLAAFPKSKSKLIWKKGRSLSKLDQVFLNLMRHQAIK